MFFQFLLLLIEVVCDIEEEAIALILYVSVTCSDNVDGGNPNGGNDLLMYPGCSQVHEESERESQD